jgi:hypothetical protein
MDRFVVELLHSSRIESPHVGKSDSQIEFIASVLAFEANGRLSVSGWLLKV